MESVHSAGADAGSPGAASPPATQRVATGVVVAVVLGVLGVCCAVPGVLAAVSVLVPRIQAQQRLSRCTDHLQTLGVVWVEERWAYLQSPGATPPPRGGPAMLRAWRDAGRVSGDVLRCPDDPGPGDLSYAVRDLAAYPFPEGHRVNAVLACLHHAGPDDRRPVLLVVGDDGAVHDFPVEDLLLDAPDDLRVGPDSPLELLRPLVAPDAD